MFCDTYPTTPVISIITDNPRKFNINLSLIFKQYNPLCQKVAGTHS